MKNKTIDIYSYLINQKHKADLCIVLESLKTRAATTTVIATASIWNYQIARPHFGLSMDNEATQISHLINHNQIQKAKDPLLPCNLCVPKNPIPNV
jgi:hypothetical protein